MSGLGYLASPWPGEDGGPRRLQSPRSGAGLAVKPGETLGCVFRRTSLSTMTVLGEPGEVYLLTHEALRSQLGLPTHSRVERIDPLTLRPLARSPRLAGGPMWPGGLAVHRDGGLIVVYGRYAHRLSRDCQPEASCRLPQDEPYNSFVILDNGLVVTKNLSHTRAARLSVLDPRTLEPVGAEAVCEEPSVARLSACGNTVYVVGVRSIGRWHWDAARHRLVADEGWRWDYLADGRQTHGWDVVLDEHHAWFMDNGLHRYRFRMQGAGVGLAANRLIRVNLADANDHASVAVSGQAGGSITNPPLVDPARGIVVGYDSANRHLRAWRIDPSSAALTPLWHHHPFGASSHLVLYPDTGELVVNDYRRLGEEVVLLDIETGRERGRVRIGGIYQGVVFPSPGWGRDLYWSSLGRVARVFVREG